MFSWPREEFLYDFKRRLRAARKRAVLAAEDRAHGSPASPARRGTAPPGTPRRLNSQRSMVERGEEVGIGLALRAPRPGTLRPNADRPISAARSRS